MRLGPRLVLTIIAVAEVVVAGQPWWHATVEGGSVPVDGNTASAGLAQALALATGGGLLLTLTVGALGRRVVGVLVALVQVGVAALGVVQPRPSETELRNLLAGHGEATLAAGPWPWVFAALGLLGLLAAAWFVRVPVTESSRPVRDGGSGVADSRDTWKAMDEGFDPTDDPQEERR